MRIFRSAIFHTPANAFYTPDALVSFSDGGLAVDEGKIVACDDFGTVRDLYPGAEVRDMRNGAIFPGFVDTHIHFPQIRIMGGLGHSLLDWLEQLTLPEEARMADLSYAQTIAKEFTDGLAAHGTTTALVFGAHFPQATLALFDAALKKGLRVISGLVLSDRYLRFDLLQTPDAAYRESQRLIESIRGHARLGYAVIPRFALSTSEAMLSVCRRLLHENPGALFTTHINENVIEIEEVGKHFPQAADYLDVYQRCDLISNRSVLAHNVQTTESQLIRIAQSGASVAHCPCSNAALGSGIFPMERHLRHNVKVALGTDVGAGTGFSVLKESLQAHLFQRVAPEPFNVTPAQMLYLATRAGAEALHLSHKLGDFTPGKSADFVWGECSQLTKMLLNPAIREVYIEGEKIHDNG